MVRRFAEELIVPEADRAIQQLAGGHDKSRMPQQIVESRRQSPRTQGMEQGMPIPVQITVFQDKSFAFTTKTPPASYFLKKAAKLKSGANNPSREMVGSVTKAQLREIAEVKMKDLSANDVEAAMKIILGSAQSMGIEVKG